MEYDWEFAQRIQCSQNEKRQCMALVAEVYSLATKAKHNGLLSLVADAEKSSHFLLRKGLQLVLEGVKPQVVRTALEYYILSGNYAGKGLLERCIIMEGVLAIQNGLNPKIIRELLLSLFGEDSYKTYEEKFEDKKKDKLQAFIKNIANNQASSPLASRLGNMIVKLNDQAIQKCLTEINTVELARAVIGIAGKAQIKIFNNLPKRSAAILHDTIEHIGPMRDSEMEEAQKKVLFIISDLEERGEILVSN